MNNNDLLNLKKAIFLIALGLYEKEHSKEQGYICSYRLRHGINIFCQFMLKNDSDSKKAFEMNETYFIKNYASKPIKDWFASWKDIDNLGIEAENFYNYDAFVSLHNKNNYYVNESCEEYIKSCLNIDSIKKLCPNVLEEIEEHSFYEKLRRLSQENYVVVREFIIKNKIISEEKLKEFRIKNALNKDVLDCIDSAYEDINGRCYVCPKCDWTMRKYGNEYVCQGKDCSNEMYDQAQLELVPANSMRIKRSIMRYIALPGMLELEIKSYCDKHKLQSNLWPQNDKYDVEIIFNNGKICEIDAKAVRNPYYLKEEIETDDEFSVNNKFDVGYYVVPDEVVRQRADYLDIVNEAIEKRVRANELKNVSCITLRQLKRIIREESQSNE